MSIPLILTMLLETLGTEPRPLACTFPADRPDRSHLEVLVTARPSLKDLPGLYRVRMEVDGKLHISGAAQPLSSTEGRDVIVRATMDRQVYYTLGVDETGAAALNVMDTAVVDEEPAEVTRVGHCRNYQPYLRTWAPS